VDSGASKVPGAGIESCKLTLRQSNSACLPCMLFAGDHKATNSSGLVHTPETLRQLEQLAVATESRRTVLLQAGTCARKSSLVAELATGQPGRLACKKLVTVHLSADTGGLAL
jgi:hypothetical protein